MKIIREEIIGDYYHYSSVIKWEIFYKNETYILTKYFNKIIKYHLIQYVIDDKTIAIMPSDTTNTPKHKLRTINEDETDLIINLFKKHIRKHKLNRILNNE